MQDYYPQEYLTGHVVFFGKKFEITPDVLIPRLDTEGLVRRARTVIKQFGIHTIVDIGTGSGIIGVSCADLAQRVVFLDISSSAIEVAKKNFYHHFPNSTKAEFIVSDLLLEPLPLPPSQPTLFIANLPYIKDNDWEHMSPDTQYEPKLALFGGQETGFELYKKLFSQLQGISLAGILLIEFGFDQRFIAEDMLNSFSWEHEFFSDYTGIERFAQIYLPTK